MNDVLGNSVTAASVQALRAYERAVDAHLHAWPGVNPALDEALADDPDFVLAHALHALWMQMFSRIDEARAACAAAEAGAPKTSAREQSHVALVSAIVGGRRLRRWRWCSSMRNSFPTDVLSASTAMGAYGLFAFSGRLDHDAARRAFIEALAPQLPAELPWLLMHRAWVRIEGGAADEGLELARRSMAARPQQRPRRPCAAAWPVRDAAPAGSARFPRRMAAGLRRRCLDVGSPAVARCTGRAGARRPGRRDPAHARTGDGIPAQGAALHGSARHGIAAVAAGTAGREQAAVAGGATTMPNGTSRRAATSSAKCTWRCWPPRGATLLPCRPDWPGSTGSRAAAMKGRPSPRPLCARCRRCCGMTMSMPSRHWQQCLPELPRIGGSHAQRAVVELTHSAGRLATADHLS